jgi:hypothetical protein
VTAGCWRLDCPGIVIRLRRSANQLGSLAPLPGRSALGGAPYAYRPGRNAQQAAVEVEELLFRGYREVVDADLAELLKQPRPPPFTGTALGRLVAGETVVANIGDQPGLRCAGI